MSPARACSSKRLASAPQISGGLRQHWNYLDGDANAPTARLTGRESGGGSGDRHSAQRTTAHLLYERLSTKCSLEKCAVVSGRGEIQNDPMSTRRSPSPSTERTRRYR